VEYKQVLETFVRETDTLVDLYVDGEVISTTNEHPFWVPGTGWVEAKDLQVGMLLQTDEETVLDIDKIERRQEKQTVYNFEVEDFHTYFVSDLGLLVHNTCADYDNYIDAAKQIQSNLGDTGKNNPTLATNADGLRTHSGWTPRPGYAQGTEQSLELAEQIGHKFRPGGYLDRGVPGRHYASHAEAQNLALNPTQEVFGVSNAMCIECKKFFSNVAQATNSPKIVADPESIKIFHPDGSIDVIPH
jgi:Pretoxin HINT domain